MVLPAMKYSPAVLKTLRATKMAVRTPGSIVALAVGVFPTSKVPKGWKPEDALGTVMPAVGRGGLRADAADGYRSEIVFKRPLSMAELIRHLDNERVRGIDLGGARLHLGARLGNGTYLPLSKAYSTADESVNMAIATLLTGGEEYLDLDNPDEEAEEEISEALRHPAKWLDDSGRWRNSKGRFIKAPGRKKAKKRA